MINPFDSMTDRLFDALEQEADLPRSQRLCPVCGQVMLTRTEREALCEVCPEHGVWFDHDQWERYTARPAYSRRPARVAARREVGYYTDGADLYESLFDLGGGD